MRIALIFLIPAAAFADTSSRKRSNSLPAVGLGFVMLEDGSVLLASGSGGDLTSEVYDPRSGRWTREGDLKSARHGHVVVRLRDGRAMAIGGLGAGYLASCEIFDPGTRKWTDTGPLHVGRAVTAATLLDDGRVLLAGGYGRTYEATVELYDPRKGAWTQGRHMNTGRSCLTLANLKDGRVLAIGGYSPGGVTNTVEVYDPRRDAWTYVAPMRQSRFYHATAVLPDGRILVFGNCNADTGVELYDPARDKWEDRSGAPVAIGQNAVWTLLPDARVLVLVGTRSLIYDPRTDKWREAAPASQAHESGYLVLLRDGRVLAAGGGGRGAEIYDPGKDQWTPTGEPSRPRRRL